MFATYPICSFGPFSLKLKQGTVLTWIINARYRRKRDKLVDRSAAARIPTMWGPFTAYCYRSIIDGIEHIAMVKVCNACNFTAHFKFYLFIYLISLEAEPNN